MIKLLQIKPKFNRKIHIISVKTILKYTNHVAIWLHLQLPHIVYIVKFKHHISGKTQCQNIKTKTG